MMKMRVCPKCGYVDNEGWQPSRFRAEVELLKFEQFKDFHPNVEFNEENLGFDELHAYLLRPKSQVVERIALFMFQDGGKSAFAIPREKYYKLPDPAQTKLPKILESDLER